MLLKALKIQERRKELMLLFRFFRPWASPIIPVVFAVVNAPKRWTECHSQWIYKEKSIVSRIIAGMTYATVGVRTLYFKGE